MKVPLALCALLLGGCLSEGQDDRPASDVDTGCPTGGTTGDCLPADLAVDLRGCEQVSYAADLLQPVYALPANYSATTALPATAQRIALISVQCAEALVNGARVQEDFQASRLGVMIQDPGTGNGTSHWYTVEAIFAPGPVATMLSRLGHPFSEGTVNIEENGPQLIAHVDGPGVYTITNQRATYGGRTHYSLSWHGDAGHLIDWYIACDFDIVPLPTTARASGGALEQGLYAGSSADNYSTETNCLGKIG